MVKQIDQLAEKMTAARDRKAAIMFTYGAHLIKNGAGPLLNRLIEAGFATHLATQGAGIIHDWEFSYQGHSGESVRENAPAGIFGAWDETGRYLNLAVLCGAADGPRIWRIDRTADRGRPDRAPLDRRVAARRSAQTRRIRAPRPRPICFGRWKRSDSKREPYRSRIRSRRVPCRRAPIETAFHSPFIRGIGYDIIVNHPMYHGGAIGRAADRDARVFTASVDRLDGGVSVSIGCAIMSPQVFEKAFSAANGIRFLEGRKLLTDHHLVIVDLQDGGGWDWSQGEPPSTNPAYYLRFCKSFYRMGGTLDYIRADNRAFLTHLLRRLGV